MTTENTAFPTFPTLYGEKEAKRLEEVQAQKKKMEEVYSTKFTPTAWSQVPPPEKAFREFISGTLFAPVVKAVTPWEWGYDYGMTPEQAQDEFLKVEKEYKELVRKERVTRVLPLIQNTLRALALSKEDNITSAEELRAYFKLSEIGFTEDEIGYIASYAQSLLLATPEQLVNGDLWNIRPVTEEEINDLAGEPYNIEPKYILSTVAFSKDMQAIGDALKEAYPPKVMDEGTRVDTTQAKYIEGLRATGMDVKEGESITDASARMYEKMADEMGEILTLSNKETGEVIVTTKRKDGTVWFEDELIGYYDEEQKTIVPMDIFTGNPLKTEQEQESWLKDNVWDALYMGLNQAYYGTMQGYHVMLKNLFSPHKNPISGKYNQVLPQKYTNIVLDWIDEKYAIEEANFNAWYEKHPELAPKPEYTLSPTEHTELLKDPGYWVYTILSQAPLMGVALGIGVATTVATKNPWAGAVAGAAAMTPAQVSDLYSDLVANGADPTRAADMATGVGIIIGSVEIVPEMIALKAISPTFMKLFKKEFQGELASQLVKGLSIKGALGTATKIEISETLEEVIQQAMQNAAIKTVNENRGILDNLSDTAIQSAIAVLPLAIFGGGSQYVQMKANLPAGTQQEINTIVEVMTDAGLTKEHAEGVALSKVMETDRGQAQIELAQEKVDAQPVVDSNAKADKISLLEGRLNDINDDIAVFESSIKAQEERIVEKKLDKDALFNMSEAKKTIDSLKEQLSELQSKRDMTIDNLVNLRKTPIIDEGVMPVKYQAKAIEEAQAEVDRLPQDTIKPNAILEINSGMVGLDKNGKVALVVRFTQEGGKLVAGLVVANKGVPKVTIGRLLKKMEAPIRALGVVPPTTGMSPEGASLAEKYEATEPVEEVPASVTLEGAPKLVEFSTEEVIREEALAGNPAIARLIKLNKPLIEARIRAKETWAGATEEQRVNIAKEAGLRKSFIAKEWEDMTPKERRTLTLAAIPDRSLKFKRVRELFDMKHYMRSLQEATGMPFYDIFVRIRISHGIARQAYERIIKRIGNDPHFIGIKDNEESLKRVAQEINAKNPDLKVEHPENMTDNELQLVYVIEETYKAYEPKVRYLRVMRTSSTIEAFKKEFPNAPEVELELALNLKKSGNTTDLWNYIQSLEWGVVREGYDPRMLNIPRLFPQEANLDSTRGEARLMTRESTDYEEELMGKNILQRLASYIKQVEAQWLLKDELDNMGNAWKEAYDKFESPGVIEGVLKDFSRELQGIPTKQSFGDMVIRRLWRQAMGTVFQHLWMPFRNLHQHITFHPDRTELARLFIDKIPPALNNKAQIYYENFVSQLSGIRTDWLYTGERGLPGMYWLLRIADKLSLYAQSDNLPRRHSFLASVNKARRATEAYEKDGNINKWIKNSGALHLTQTERNYVLQLLAQGDAKTDLAIPGLRAVSGRDMANLYIGHEVADITHFIYERAFRASVEMGATGRTIFNLMVFPRGYFQRITLNFNKVFAADSVWNPETRDGFKQIVLLFVMGELVSRWLQLVSGRKRRSYSPFDIMQWQVGGLALGAVQDVFTLINDLITVLSPGQDKARVDEALGRIPSDLKAGIQVQVPLYRHFIDSIDAMLDTDNIDLYVIRKLRSILDDNYTPAELEELDMSLWEKMRKAVLGGDIEDPNKFIQIQVDLQEAQARLGEKGIDGKFYTVSQLGGTIASLTKDLPDEMLTEEYNFSDLVVFYKECEDKWKEYYELPTTSGTARREWRESHIEEEAMLLFWGKVGGSVFKETSPEWKEIHELLRVWLSLYDIEETMHPEWDTWVTRA